MKWHSSTLISPTIWSFAGWWNARKIVSRSCGQFYRSLKITTVKRRENEHPVNYLAFDDERGVRFDAIIEDDRERFYDVEMQVAN